MRLYSFESMTFVVSGPSEISLCNVLHSTAKMYLKTFSHHDFEKRNLRCCCLIYAPGFWEMRICFERQENIRTCSAVPWKMFEWAFTDTQKIWKNVFWFPLKRKKLETVWKIFNVFCLAAENILNIWMCSVPREIIGSILK